MSDVVFSPRIPPPTIVTCHVRFDIDQRPRSSVSDAQQPLEL